MARSCSADNNVLLNAKEAAVNELKNAGITSELLLNNIRNAKTVEGVNSIKAETLASHEKSLEDAKNEELRLAKEAAINELRNAGVTSEFLLNGIRNANTIDGVNNLKNELLASHAASTADNKVEWTIIFKFPNGHEVPETFEVSPEENEDLIAYDKANSYGGSYSYDKDTDTNTITVTFDAPEEDNSTPLVPIEDAEEIEEVTLKGTFHFPEGAQDATFTDENGSAAYGQLRDYAYKFEAKYGEPSIVRNDDDTYDIYYDNYVAPKEEVTLKGTFHFPGSNGQDATFTGVDGKDAYAKLRDYAYSFEKEFGEPSIMKNDDDTYDIYYDLYKKPEEKEDFTITVKVFKPYQGEDNYYASATFTSDRYDGDYDKAMADVWNWADAQSGARKYRAEIVSKYEIHIHELEESKTSIPWTDLTPAKPIKKPCNDWVFPFPLPFPIEGAEIVVPAPEKPAPDNIAPIGPGPVIPTPVTPAPEIPVEEDDDKTENIDVDSIIKDIDERNKEILDEMAKIDTTITDENKKPADEDKKPVDEDKKPSDDEKQPSKEKEVVKVPAKAHSNPKTGVAGISAVAGTLAISMAGIVATRKKND